MRPARATAGLMSSTIRASSARLRSSRSWTVHWPAPNIPSSSINSTWTLSAARLRCPWPHERNSRHRRCYRSRRHCSPIPRSRASRALTMCSSKSGASVSMSSTRLLSRGAWQLCKYSRARFSPGAWGSADTWSGRPKDNSKKLMLGAFGKQPRYCWLVPNGKTGGGVEIEVPLDRLDKGDIVGVHTGEVVPVDGIIVDGLSVIDQHALTGESMPAEKGVGDRVFASTVMVAGKMYVAVEKSGSETATARIAQILNDTAGYKLASQHRGEKLADKAVIPTLGLGGLAFATLGPTGAVAVINSDLGTGIRMAAPLAMLSTVALCAQRGVLVKDGRALDLLCEVDTVLFDKTGTLTRERPEIGRMIGANGYRPLQILRFAAAAERKFHHPIALAILQKAAEQGLRLPSTDATQYKVGYGITVGIPDGVKGVHQVRVGSRRFMETEGVPLTREVEAALDEAHREGHTMVMIAVDDGA